MKPYLFQHLFDQTVEKYSKKEFIKQKDNSFSYNKIRAHSLALAKALRELKINLGDRVGIWLDKSPEQVISLLGTLYADGIFVIISPVLHHDQTMHILKDCNVKFLITDVKKFNILSTDLENTEVAQIILVDESLDNTISMQELLETYSGYQVESVAKNSDTSNIIYTSGSTGKPKGIVLSHQNLIEGAEIVSEYLNITDQERIAGVLPFNFDYGLNQLTTSILKGASLVLHNFFLPNDLLNLLEKEEITGLAGIPPIWTAIFNTKLTAKKKCNFSKLRYLTNSGGKVPVPIVKNMRDFFPNTDIYLMYGLTEAFRSTYLPPSEIDKRPNSIGKAIPRTEMFIINNQGKECAPHEKGELIHKGACITKGYWNDPEKTNQIFRPDPLAKPGEKAQTVVYSGDLIYKDEEGFLYFVSRKDEMIKVQGYRVSPTEVEEILLKHESIQDAVVFGIEARDGEKKILALITTNQDINSTNIIEHCKKEAPSYMVPHEIIFYKSFPKTASGKIDRAILKRECLVHKEG
ncbi:MAG: acyl-CoA ligase (AMP-forming), exosortase A system-associated [Candidatus Margulisbacteria bacterium]|nr:acyl-CoA ligase (AMP-forming), exosortase A system-associated [Candidatus Margulisiibacteriota bacterium]